jgi:hypothetical protein
VTDRNGILRDGISAEFQDEYWSRTSAGKCGVGSGLFRAVWKEITTEISEQLSGI